MGGLDGYMARIANWVAVCETTCKKTTQSEPTHGNGDSGLRVQGRECVGHRPQVVVGVGDSAEVSIWESWSLSSVAWRETTGGWQWRTCLMPWASLKSNANRSQPILPSVHRRPNRSRDTRNYK